MRTHIIIIIAPCQQLILTRRLSSFLYSSRLVAEMTASEPAEFPADMIFEQDPVQILNAILPLYLNGQILRTLQESVASELAARMQSMQSASDNAGALESELSMQYNRARQAAVTAELLEIVAGASAIEG